MKKFLCASLLIIANVVCASSNESGEFDEAQSGPVVRNLTNRDLSGRFYLDCFGAHVSRGIKILAGREYRANEAWVARGIEICELTAEGDSKTIGLMHRKMENYGKVYEILPEGEGIKIIKQK